jgi:hypothetical protein
LLILILILKKWIISLQISINDDNRIKLQIAQNARKNTPSLIEDKNQNLVKFELNELLAFDNSKEDSQKTYDSFLVRFLGSMNVKYNDKNKTEYINETIRNVMAARAQNNLFKLNEFNLVIKSNMIYLSKSVTTDNSTARFDAIEDEVIKAKFKLTDLAVWSPHKDNKRLFGFISKDSNQSLKFTCYVFESDIDSVTICSSITKVNELAFQMNSEYFKKIKETEKEILLQNIRNLPDKTNDQTSNESSIDEDQKDLLNAVSIVMSSNNPNFIALDKDVLDSYNNNNNNNNSEVNKIEDNEESKVKNKIKCEIESDA